MTYLETEYDGENGVNGLFTADGLAVSPDGANVYVAGDIEDAVVVFRRNSSNGTLTFLQVLTDDEDGVTGINGAQYVAVSPDGAHVYATSRVDHAITLFDRNPGTGALTFVESQQYNDPGPVDGLAEVTVAPNGRYVYVASILNDAIGLYARDRSTGRLTLLERKENSAEDVEGLNGAAHISAAPDAAHIYVSAVIEDSLSLFKTLEGKFVDGTGDIVKCCVRV